VYLQHYAHTYWKPPHTAVFMFGPQGGVGVKVMLSLPTSSRHKQMRR